MLAVRDASILHQESSLQVSSCASFNVGLLCGYAACSDVVGGETEAQRRLGL